MAAEAEDAVERIRDVGVIHPWSRSDICRSQVEHERHTASEVGCDIQRPEANRDGPSEPVADKIELVQTDLIRDSRDFEDSVFDMTRELHSVHDLRNPVVYR